MAVKLEQDKSYETKSGNHIRCLAVQKDKAGKEFALCAYTKIVAPGHEALAAGASKWNLDGTWQSPTGVVPTIHDIVKAL